jgi:ABC-type multidrug transport system fused ATPase/permease subunit
VPAPLAGIDSDDVAFTYPANEPAALGLNLHTAAAAHGPVENGAGKSTLVKLLRFYDGPGRVRVGGADVVSCILRNWADRIGVLFRISPATSQRPRERGHGPAGRSRG